MTAKSEKNTKRKGILLGLFGNPHNSKTHGKKKTNHFLIGMPSLHRIIGSPKSEKRKEPPQDSIIPDSLFFVFKNDYRRGLNKGIEPYGDEGLFSRKNVQILLEQDDIVERLERERIGLVETYQRIQDKLKTKKLLEEKEEHISQLKEVINKYQKLLAKIESKKGKSKEKEELSLALRFRYDELSKLYEECHRQSLPEEKETQPELHDKQSQFESIPISDNESSDEESDYASSSEEDIWTLESAEAHLTPQRRKRWKPPDIQEEPTIFPKEDQREVLQKLTLEALHENPAEIFETKFKIAALEAEYDTCLTRKKRHKKAEEKTFVAKTGMITKKLKRFDEKNNISNELRCFYKRLAKLVSKKNKKEKNYYKEQEQNYAFASKQLEIKKAALLQAEKELPNAAEPRDKAVIEGAIKVQLTATVATISYAEQANIHEELAKLYKELADRYFYEAKCESDEYAQAIEDAAEATLFSNLMTDKAHNRAGGRYPKLQR